MNLSDLKKTLWAAADKLRSNMDAADYKHIVLGLIFLKYISDAFEERQAELRRRFSTPTDEYFVEEAKLRSAELEERDYYTEASVFWVPESARWDTIRKQAKQPNIGKIIDDALLSIEAENAKLKGILDKRFARAQLEPGKLGELVDLISTIGFGGSAKSKDVLGQVYEYFLGQFASAEGKKGGQFYTPASVVQVLVEIMAPHKGKVYDPCCGSGGMFVQSERFVESHGGRFGDISIYGQESNPTTWRLVAMNLVIRGMDFNLGKEPADTFARDQHPDLRADYVLANPPFNVSDWGGEKFQDDVRWKYGSPPVGNANFAWLQHILYHLKPDGTAGVVLANNATSSGQTQEYAIRKAMVENDVIDCMVALPQQLFFNTPISACLWFLRPSKSKPGRKRRGQVLFIDARQLGSMETRTLRVFNEEEVKRIASAYHAWRETEGFSDYVDIAGFCKAASLEDIAENDFVLTPGRYVGTDISDDATTGHEELKAIVATLEEQFSQSQELQTCILANLSKLGLSNEQ